MKLAITGLGMISSVGRDAPQSCASIRAGIVRTCELSYFQVVDPETQDVTPVVGHPIRGFAEGFNLVGLWTRLARKCVAELLTGVSVPADTPKFWRRTAFLAAIPYIDDDRFQATGDESPDLITRAFLDPLVEDLGLPIPEGNLAAVCKGHAATICALALGDEMIATGKVERALVIAVDSHLDTLSLEWLASLHRLKEPANPVGLAPGEAAACLLVEHPDSAARRGARVRATIETVSLGVERNNLFSGEPNRGMGLADVLRQALSHVQAPKPFQGALISDLNGEEWRATELAGARLLLDPLLAQTCPLLLPAVSVGDVGAASGAVSIGLAVHAFDRRYAASDHTLVLSSSDHGDLGVACVRSSS